MPALRTSLEPMAKVAVLLQKQSQNSSANKDHAVNISCMHVCFVSKRVSQSTARTDCVTYLPVSSHTFPHLFQWGCFVFVYSNLKVVKLTPCTHANTVFVSNKQTHHHQWEIILRSATICSTRLKRFTRSSASYAGPGQDSSQSARIHVKPPGSAACPPLLLEMDWTKSKSNWTLAFGFYWI